MKSKIIFLIILFLIFVIPEVTQVQGQTINDQKHYTGIISWLQDSYSVNSDGVIQVIDKDMIVNPNQINYLQVHVWSYSDAKGTDVTLSEIKLGSDTFQGTVHFTNIPPSHGNTLYVSDGDKVTAEYVDLFSNIGTPVKLDAKFDISQSSPPPEPGPNPPPNPSFEIGVLTNQFNILSGQSVSSQINIITSNDIQSVTLSCDTTIPSNSGNCIVSPSTIKPGQVAQFTIYTDNSTSVSEYKGIITGTSGNIVKQIPFSVIVEPSETTDQKLGTLDQQHGTSGTPSWVAPVAIGTTAAAGIGIAAKSGLLKNLFRKPNGHIPTNQEPSTTTFSPIQSIEIEIKGGFEK